MKKNILLIVLSAIGFSSFAQQKHITFSDSIKISLGSNYLDYFKVAESANFDGYFLGSKFDDFSNLSKFYVSKTDFTGQLLWDTVFYFQEPFSPYGNSINSMISESNELIFSSQVSGTSASNRAQPFMVNVDNAGSINWNKYYEIDTLEFYNTSVIKSNDGGYILFGGASDWSSFGLSTEYGYVYKLDAAGVLQWSKFYADKDTTEFQFVSGAVTNNDVYVFAGNAKNNKSGGGRPGTPGTWDNFVNVVAVDVNGDLLWNSALYFDSPVDNGGYFNNISVNVLNSQQVIVSFKYYNTINSYYEMGLVSFDANTGNIDWAKNYSIETESSSFNLVKVIQKKDGNLIVYYDDNSNDSKSDLLELDYNGNIVQNKTIQEFAGSNTYYNDIIPTEDGGVFVAANLLSGSGLLSFKTDKDLNAHCASEYLFTSPTVSTLTFDTYAIVDTIFDVNPIEGSLTAMPEAEITSVNDVYCSCELSVYGNVSYSGLFADSVKVFLYHVNANGNYIKMDSVDTDVAGYYQFLYLPEGNYAIKAIPSKIKYPNYLPTYYGLPNHTTQWDSAFVYSIACGNNPMAIDVDLIQKLPQSGGWQCNGYVLEYYGYNSGLRRAPGDPIPDIDITIDQSPGGTISSTTTDQNGYYAFTGLNNNASFIVRADIPGLPNDSIYTFVVTPGDPAMDSLNFYVDTVGVYILPEYIFTGVDVINLNEFNVNILPNPTSANFVLEINAIASSNMNIKMMNSLGEVVISKTPIITKGLNRVDFELQNQPPGIYFLSINYNNNHFVKKIIKQ